MGDPIRSDPVPSLCGRLSVRMFYAAAAGRCYPAFLSLPGVKSNTPAKYSPTLRPFSVPRAPFPPACPPVPTLAAGEQVGNCIEYDFTRFDIPEGERDNATRVTAGISVSRQPSLCSMPSQPPFSFPDDYCLCAPVCFSAGIHSPPELSPSSPRCACGWTRAERQTETRWSWGV